MLPSSTTTAAADKLITHLPPPATVPPSYYRIMALLSKCKRSIREVAKERERQCKAKKIQEHGWESSEVEEDVTALGLLQGSGAGSASDLESESGNDEVLVSEGEEEEEVDKSAFRKLMASAVE